MLSGIAETMLSGGRWSPGFSRLLFFLKGRLKAGLQRTLPGES